MGANLGPKRQGIDGPSADLRQFAAELHTAETALLASAGAGDPGLQRALGAYLERFLFGSNAFSGTQDLDKAGLVDASLWRLAANPTICESLMLGTQFLDPDACWIQQAELVAVIGRLVGQSEAVRTFLEDINSRESLGVIAANSAAVGKAQQALLRDDEVAPMPTQADSLRRAGIVEASNP